MKICTTYIFMFIYSIHFIFILLHKEKKLFTLESKFKSDSKKVHLGSGLN